MRKINTKYAIIIYAVLMIFFFLGFVIFASYLFKSKIQNNASGYGAFYKLDNDNVQQIIGGDGISGIDYSKIVPTNEYDQKLISALQKTLMPLSAMFCAFLIFSTILLWLILKRINKKDKLKIVDELLEFFEKEKNFNKDIEFQNAYRKLRNKFESHISDYKRLNSFLSHEQKNAISILQNKLDMADKSDYLPSLNRISDNIDDVLTLSEAVTKSAETIVDASLITAYVCDSYKHLKKDIVYQFDEDGNTDIPGKERWIYRAVSNLISNAIKYGGNEAIIVSVQNKYGSVIISVADKGMGIRREKANQIFAHSYRINELNKDGHGIGLSLVSHVCDLCGGFVYVESEENIGSTFYMSFPAVGEAQ